MVLSALALCAAGAVSARIFLGNNNGAGPGERDRQQGRGGARGKEAEDR